MTKAPRRKRPIPLTRSVYNRRGYQGTLALAALCMISSLLGLFRIYAVVRVGGNIPPIVVLAAIGAIAGTIVLLLACGLWKKEEEEADPSSSTTRNRALAATLVGSTSCILSYMVLGSLLAALPGMVLMIISSSLLPNQGIDEAIIEGEKLAEQQRASDEATERTENKKEGKA